MRRERSWSTGCLRITKSFRATLFIKFQPVFNQIVTYYTRARGEKFQPTCAFLFRSSASTQSGKIRLDSGFSKHCCIHVPTEPQFERVVFHVCSCSWVGHFPDNPLNRFFELVLVCSCLHGVPFRPAIDKCREDFPILVELIARDTVPAGCLAQLLDQRAHKVDELVGRLHQVIVRHFTEHTIGPVVDHESKEIFSSTDRGRLDCFSGRSVYLYVMASDHGQTVQELVRRVFDMRVAKMVFELFESAKQ